MRQSETMHHGIQVSRITLEADAAHPNRMKLRGVLVRLDEPSSKPPNGAQGHRILVTTEVAKQRLNTLIGMGLNYSPDLNTHAQRRKVGVIDKAWIDGKDLKIEGHIWKHDFPEAEKDLKQSGLGMSMELGDVRVDDPKADVWTLDDFQFLGATILWRNDAAYTRTQAIAARAEQRRGSMAIPKAKTSAARTSQGEHLAQIAAEAAAGVVHRSSKQILAAIKSQTEVLGSMAAAQADLDERIAALEDGTTDEIEARGGSSTSSSSCSSEDEDDLETRRVKARKVKAGRKMKTEEGGASSSSSSSEDEMGARKLKAAKRVPASSSSSTSSEDEMDSAGAVDTGDLEEINESEGNTGHTNEDAENRGDDGAGDLIKKVGKTVESAKLRSLRHQLRASRQQIEAQNEVIAKLESKMNKLQTQVSAASATISRRSVSPEISAMLAKSNIDANDLFRTGTRLSVGEVDGILASTGVQLNPQDRMAIKNGFIRSGLMDEGRVERGNSR